MSRVAVIGLGAMGARVAARLLRAGHEVIVWNRTSAKAEPLLERGARAAASPADAAQRARVVITMVADRRALRAVTEGDEGLLAGTGRGTTLIEMSTVGPEAISRLASLLPPEVGLLDAPVLGSLTEAEAGELTVFAGGPAALVARCTPLLSTLGTVLQVGPLGAGAAAKLVANSTLFGTLGLLGEALVLAEGLGLSQEIAFEVLARTPLAAQAERRRPAIESGDYPPRFSLSLARKDAELISEAAAISNLDLVLADVQRRRLREAERARWGSRDYSALVAWTVRAASDASTSTLLLTVARRGDTAEG